MHEEHRHQHRAAIKSQQLYRRRNRLLLLLPALGQDNGPIASDLTSTLTTQQAQSPVSAVNVVVASQHRYAKQASIVGMAMDTPTRCVD